MKGNVRHSSPICAIFVTGLWATQVVLRGDLAPVATVLVTTAPEHINLLDIAHTVSCLACMSHSNLKNWINVLVKLQS